MGNHFSIIVNVRTHPLTLPHIKDHIKRYQHPEPQIVPCGSNIFSILISLPIVIKFPPLSQDFLCVSDIAPSFLYRFGFSFLKYSHFFKNNFSANIY